MIADHRCPTIANRQMHDVVLGHGRQLRHDFVTAIQLPNEHAVEARPQHAPITETDVVFDAPTTQGGSGGPLLDRNGQVIGIAYAVLSRFGGNSFAVPVSRALPLVTGRPARDARKGP